jgi:two-component system NtrC family sensor kinase
MFDMSRSSLLTRSIALPVIITSGLLMLTLVGMLVITHRGLNRMTPMQAHLAVMQSMHDQMLAMQQIALRGMAVATPIRHDTLLELQKPLFQLMRGPALMTETGQRGLKAAHDLLDDAEPAPRERLQQGITLLQAALVAENRGHAELLEAVRSQARLEQRLAATALVFIPLMGALVLFLLRRRFLLPLNNINALLTRLGEGDFAPARVTAVDPVLEPLVANYNDMVTRLARLEAEQQARQAGLEAEVRMATRDLLAHNRSLAQAERLAAVGEMAASLAHELRNPLAGIQLALANLREDLAEIELRARLDQVSAELGRTTELMNGLLNQARLTPETATPVHLARMTAEVLALAHYQAPTGIVFEMDIADDLHCLLPENRVRQALLNLALNAAQIMDADGTIQVSARRIDDQLRLSVSDQGPGFPEPMLRTGVRPFASRRAGGTGLGLASVRRLAQDLGGALQLENLKPRGARVTLLLPCPPEEA